MRFSMLLDSLLGTQFPQTIPPLQSDPGDTQEAPSLIPTLQDNVLIPEDFAEYIYHIGNVTDVHSLTNSRPIPGGKGVSEKERQCVFFTAVNPMDEHRFPANARYILDKARIVADKNEWKVHQNAVYRLQLETCSQERIAVLSKPIARITGPPSGHMAPSRIRTHTTVGSILPLIPLLYLMREALQVLRDARVTHMTAPQFIGRR